MPEWLLELISFDESPKGSHRPKEKKMAQLPTWAEVEPGPEDSDIIAELEAGKEGERFQLLAEGYWRAAGYPTQSEADLAFFNKVARLTNGEAGRMYAIFKGTGLMRDHDDKPFSYYQPDHQEGHRRPELAASPGFNGGEVPPLMLTINHEAGLAGQNVNGMADPSRPVHAPRPTGGGCTPHPLWTIYRESKRKDYPPSHPWVRVPGWLGG